MPSPAQQLQGLQDQTPSATTSPHTAEAQLLELLRLLGRLLNHRSAHVMYQQMNRLLCPLQQWWLSDSCSPVALLKLDDSLWRHTNSNNRTSGCITSQVLTCYRLRSCRSFMPWVLHEQRQVCMLLFSAAYICAVLHLLTNHELFTCDTIKCITSEQFIVCSCSSALAPVSQSSQRASCLRV